MLDYKQIHLLIEQGVNGIALFAEGSYTHEQVDLIINYLVIKDLRSLKDKKIGQRNFVDEELLRSVTANRVTLPLSYNGRYFEVNRPEDFSQLSGSFTLVANCNCKSSCSCKSVKTCATVKKNTVLSIQEGKYYVAKTSLKYNNKWYKPNEYFIGVFGNAFAYGTYEELYTQEKINFDVGIDQLETYSLSALVKNSLRPLLAYDQNKFYIYYDTCGRNKEIPLTLLLNYTKDFTKGLSISWCDKRTLGFSETLQSHYIDEAIAYIATIDKQDQQNIINLKSETI